MSMTPREVVRRTIRFEGADRLPYALAPDYGSDFGWVGMSPSPDARPRSGDKFLMAGRVNPRRYSSRHSLAIRHSFFSSSRLFRKYTRSIFGRLKTYWRCLRQRVRY